MTAIISGVTPSAVRQLGGAPCSSSSLAVATRASSRAGRGSPPCSHWWTSASGHPPPPPPPAPQCTPLPEPHKDHPRPRGHRQHQRRRQPMLDPGSSPGPSPGPGPGHSAERHGTVGHTICHNVGMAMGPVPAAAGGTHGRGAACHPGQQHIQHPGLEPVRCSHHRRVGVGIVPVPRPSRSSGGDVISCDASSCCGRGAAWVTGWPLDKATERVSVGGAARLVEVGAVVQQQRDDPEVPGLTRLDQWRRSLQRTRVRQHQSCGVKGESGGVGGRSRRAGW